MFGFTPHDPTEDTESTASLRTPTGAQEVSPLTIRQRILKAPDKMKRRVSIIGFTPHDPTEDTESQTNIAQLNAVMGFTPHDPTEDTESLFGPQIIFIPPFVSPLTIRQRILKAPESRRSG